MPKLDCPHCGANGSYAERVEDDGVHIDMSMDIVSMAGRCLEYQEHPSGSAHCSKFELMMRSHRGFDDR